MGKSGMVVQKSLSKWLRRWSAAMRAARPRAYRLDMFRWSCAMRFIPRSQFEFHDRSSSPSSVIVFVTIGAQFPRGNVERFESCNQ
jgi:hypothetical protein